MKIEEQRRIIIYCFNMRNMLNENFFLYVIFHYIFSMLFMKKIQVEEYMVVFCEALNKYKIHYIKRQDSNKNK